VPCNLQPAKAGSNSKLRLIFVSPAILSGVDDWVLRNENLRTPPGPEGSNGKQDLSCAVELPDRSRLISVRSGKFSQSEVHGHIYI
jgi:hypothetical protein